MANRNLSDYRINEITSRLKDKLYLPLRALYRKTAPSRILLTRSYLLDDEWYLQQYPDVVEAQTTPAKHYLRHGARENRDPGPFFSTSWYRQQYPDVGQSEQNPLLHYLRFGEEEGRLTGPSFRRRRGAPPSSTSTTNENLSNKQKQQVRDRLIQDLNRFLNSADTLDFQHRSQPLTSPKVSVIIVTWNKAEFTLATLRNLATTTDVNLEVVIIDNGSTDDTSALFDRLEGVTIVREASNQGFVKAVNTGAAIATGEYLLLLNNDAQPRADAISRAVSFLDDEPSCGAVGARLILPSGLLQEAGSIIWQDGSCVGYLRNEPPEIGEAMFVRPVDFCSAAFLMIRRSSWLSLGGFNETYSPAYYEEVDFCCRLIERGEYVVYLPNVVVDHYEFASTAGMARATQMQMNRRDIFTRLNEKFLTDQLPADGKNVVRARDRDPRPSVLIIDDQIPRESAGQGFPRIVRLVRLLTDRGYRVCIGATSHEGSVDWPGIWQELGTTVECIPDLSPRTLEAFLEERSGSYQVLWVSRPHNLRYLTEIEGRRPGLISAPLIYDAEALVASNALGNEGAAIDIAELQQAARPETDATHLASAIVSVSELDRGVFAENTQKPTFIASHSLEIKEGQSPFGDRRGVLFFGALSNVKSPNVNGLDWFIQEVWPLMPAVLQREHPLTVAGQVLPSLTKKWQAQGVEVLGLVADLSELADEKRAFVAPTRRAQGIPIKALEAASYGLPMVMTAILAQQLNWRNEEQALVASNPQEFADALTRLLTEEALWKSLRKEAAASVAKICDPEKFNENVLAALNLFVEPPQGSN